MKTSFKTFFKNLFANKYTEQEMEGIYYFGIANGMMSKERNS